MLVKVTVKTPGGQCQSGVFIDEFEGMPLNKKMKFSILIDP